MALLIALYWLSWPKIFPQSYFLPLGLLHYRLGIIVDISIFLSPKHPYCLRIVQSNT